MAEWVTATGTEAVPLNAIAVGDVLLVRPGARVPADGVVADGVAHVDESMITGGSRPVAKAAGDRVVAGTVAAGGSLRIGVDAVGEQTALSGIMRMVAAAQASASRAQALADRAAALLFYVALAAGVITLVAWWLLGEPEAVLVRTATVLVIPCPHALGLAIPLVTSIPTSLGAPNRLLVKDRIAVERTRTLDVVILDKTGTLTRGEPALVEVASAKDLVADEVLRSIAGAESDSEHPHARAIVEGARRRGLEPRTGSDFRAEAGVGVRATVDGQDVRVGGPGMIAAQGLADAVPTELAGPVAAQVLPADKAAAVKRFQQGGRRVAMVGDGSTTPLPSRPPMSASLSTQAPTWRSNRRASCWCAATHATWWAPSCCRVPATAG